MSHESERERQSMLQQDGEGLTAAILYRRKRKCVAQDSHSDGGCARCGQ